MMDHGQWGANRIPDPASATGCSGAAALVPGGPGTAFALRVERASRWTARSPVGVAARAL